MEELAKRIESTGLFGALTIEQLLHILHQEKQFVVKKDDIILSEEEENDSHVFVLSGEVEVQRFWQSDTGQLQHSSSNLKPKQLDGGFSYINASSFRMRIKALTDVEYLLINADLLDSVLGVNGQITGISKDENKKHLNILVNNISVFHQLPIENIHKAVERLKLVEAKKGEEIVVQGDSGDNFYILESGKGQIWKKDVFTDEVKMVDEIYSGDSFGEEALVQDGYRNATIKMITPAKLWALSKDDFNELIKPGLVDEITSVKAQKEIETNQVVIIDCRYEMEFEESRIPGALHVPLDQIRWDIHELNPKNKYIVYCRSGRRSKAAAFLMQERKYNAVSLAGGIKDWPYQIDDKEILLSDY